MNAYNVNATRWEQEQRSYISGLATGQRMTSRYSRREGAPLQEREGGRVETRDAGRRRGPRRHPRPLPRAAFSQNPPATLSFLPSPPYPLARTLAPSSPLSRPRLRGAIRRFTPAILPTDSVRRSYSSSSLFLRFFRSSPPSTPNSFAHPCSITFFYRILYSSCHPRVRCAAASRFFITYLPPSHILHR